MIELLVVRLPLDERGAVFRAPGRGKRAERPTRRVRTDYRGDVLRFGSAPYLTDEQLREAMAALGEVAR